MRFVSFFFEMMFVVFIYLFISSVLNLGIFGGKRISTVELIHFRLKVSTKRIAVRGP